MDNTIIVGLLGAASTLAAPLVTLICERYIEDLKYQKPNSSRRLALLGDWEGETSQESENSNSRRRVRLRVRFTKSNRKVKGDSTVQWQIQQELKSLEIDFTGGFIYEDFIKLDYKSIDPSVKNFGTILLQLSANGKMLKGRMLGFGSEAERIVFGITELRKQN
jgi:hypothetical protein